MSASEMLPLLKRCNICRTEKPLEDFSKDASTKDGLTRRCSPCNRAYVAQWHAKNPDAKRSSQLKRYGMTIESYAELLRAQGGGCAICGEPCSSGNQLSVDHNHACCPDRKRSCGRCVRGLLCSDCNRALGLLQDNPARLRAAVNYLERKA